MHRNPWWLTPDGPTLDSGALVTGLEFATERPARILGKPSPAFFREAAGALAGGGPRAVADGGSSDPGSRWSATTSGPTSWRPVGSASAGSSSCPASTAWPTSPGRPRQAVAAASPTPSPGRSCEVVAALG